MTSETDQPTSTTTYVLTCTDCTFETNVRGSVYEALQAAKSHRVGNGDADNEHFVDFTLKGHE